MKFRFPVVIIDEDFRSENTSGLGVRALAKAIEGEGLEVLGVTGNYFTFSFRRYIGATEVVWTPQLSTNLTSWEPADLTLHGSVNNGDGTETVTYRSATTPPGTRAFGQLKVLVGP